ncbi:MAG: hypothetical protein IPK50_08605 [Fibrobacterota bacterium]|nr:MAG: hypothetical protein IPK50_08605 [Fibrobacterota bacterium]
MLTEYGIKVNLIAQSRIDQEVGMRWFLELDKEDREKVLHLLALCCHQARPTDAEIETAIIQSKLEPTYTACVLARDAPTDMGFSLSRIASLPKNESPKSFTLLIQILSVSDARRRATHCKNGCTHEWHNL